MAIEKVDVEGIIDHITVTKVFSDGKLVGYELRPHEGYVMLLHSLTLDDEGNSLPDEEYRYSIYALAPVNCDLKKEFKAVKYEEGMEILGLKDEQEIM